MGNALRTRPDLAPLFGPLQTEDNDRLLDRLLQIDDQLVSLAEEAGRHVGVPYNHMALCLYGGASHGEICGGPSGKAGDIWFVIETPFDETMKTSHSPPWIVESKVVVFCLDPPPDPYNTCTHDLAAVRTTANTSAAAVDALAAHVSQIRKAILSRSPHEFRESSHAALAAIEAGAAAG